jgi:hypothetical protein
VQTLLDPYAKYVKGRAVFGQRDEFEQFKGIEGSVFRGTFDFESAPFDWGSDYKKPNLPLKDLIIAELPVRLFTGVAGGLPVPGDVVGREAQGWGGQGCAAAVCTKGLRNVSRGVRPAVTVPHAGVHALFGVPACCTAASCLTAPRGLPAMPALSPCAASESSGLPEGQRGTYAGLAAKVEHFKELGINAGEQWRRGRKVNGGMRHRCFWWCELKNSVGGSESESRGGLGWAGG